MDETGWHFELRFTGHIGVHPDRSYTIFRSDELIGNGGRVIVSRIASDATTEVEYKKLSRFAFHDITVAGTPVVRVRRAFGGNIVGEWLPDPAKQAASVPAAATPTLDQEVSVTNQKGKTDPVRQNTGVPFETVRGSSALGEQWRRPAALRIDSTFGSGGAVFGDFMNIATPIQARAVVAGPDGHVVVAGSIGDEQAPEGRNIGLIRFDKDGRRDPDFGTDGYKVLDLEGVDNVARALVLQPDGKIIVAGEILSQEHDTYDFALVRLDARGQLDSDFGGGVVTTDFLKAAKNDRAYAVKVQADGKVVAAGYSEFSYVSNDTRSEESHTRLESGMRECFALARYNTDGSVDSAFGRGGPVMTAMGTGLGARNRARALQVQADGRLLTAGFACSDTARNRYDVALVRYSPDGRVDETFGREGRVVFSSGGEDEGAHALAVQDDGKIVIAGATARDAESEQHFLVARLNPDGKLDQTFGGTGTVVNREFVGLARGVVVLPDGRIVAAGSAAVTVTTENDERVTREQVALVCYMPNGSVDETFGTRGVLFIDLGGSEDSAAGIVLSGDRIFVAGTSRVGAKSEFALICLVKN